MMIIIIITIILLLSFVSSEEFINTTKERTLLNSKTRNQKPEAKKVKREISSQQPETVLYRYIKNGDTKVCVGKSQI